MLIFIDPGHGGEDPGRIGHKHLYEAEVNWSVAVALSALLNDRGLKPASPGNTAKPFQPVRGPGSSTSMKAIPSL